MFYLSVTLIICFSQVIPLNQSIAFHLIFIGGVTFWSILHILTHFCSLAFDEESNSTIAADHFADNLTYSINPVVTGLLICLVLIITVISSLPAVQKLCRFIGFYCIHYTALVMFYLLLLIHGKNHFNPAFWKWLLPVLLIFCLEKLYTILVIKKHTININKVFAYDETSRTLSVVIEKPKHFRFVPGQFVLLNIPQIGKNYCTLLMGTIIYMLNLLKQDISTGRTAVSAPVIKKRLFMIKCVLCIMLT